MCSGRFLQSRRLLQVISVAAALAGCRADFFVEPTVRGARPFAQPGTGSTYLVGTTITLDATGSRDPDGELRSYRWTVLQRPTTSKASIADDTAPVTTFVVDAVGSYDFSLEVTDSDGLTDTGRLTVMAAGPVITVDAGTDAATLWHTTVQLSGSFSVEGDFPATIAWTLMRPAGSTAPLIGANTLTPSFVPDQEGTFVARLTVRTAHAMASDDVAIAASIPRQRLAYAVVDAEYSTALDRIVMVSDNPAQLHLHNPADGTDTAVALAYAPRSVGLSPDGLRAAVAHVNYVTIVNLQTQATSTLPVNITSSDVVFGADNRVHLPQLGGNPWSYLWTLDLATGMVTQQSGGLSGSIIHSGMRARLHPSGLKMYGVDTSVSPANLHRFNVATAPVTYDYFGPYHGTYTIGGNVWFTQDGSTVITFGNLFRATNDPMTDMTYVGELERNPGTYPQHQWIIHSSTTGKLVTATYEDMSVNGVLVTTNNVRVYNATTFALEKVTPIPPTPLNGTYYAGRGVLVAYRSDLTKVYVLANAGVAGFVIYEVAP